MADERHIGKYRFVNDCVDKTGKYRYTGKYPGYLPLSIYLKVFTLSLSLSRYHVVEDPTVSPRRTVNIGKTRRMKRNCID